MTVEASDLNDDAQLTMIVIYARQKEGLITSTEDLAEFFGWTLERAHAAGACLVAHGVVKPLYESKDPVS